MSKPIVGIDLGGTNMQVGVVRADNQLVGDARKKTKAGEGLDAVMERIARAVHEACEEAGITVADLDAVGLAAPGAVDAAEGVVLEAVNLGWNDVKAAKLLSTRLGVPVFLDNDVNAALFGEVRLGTAVGADDVLGVWIGTGIGGGLFLNGRIYNGGFRTAGEIGHMILFPNNPPGMRSLENNCSRTAVVDRLVRMIHTNYKTVLPKLVDGDLDRIKSKTLARAYHDEKDGPTIEVIDNVADLLGMAIAGVVTLLSLPLVVLGGGLTEAMGDSFVERVERSTRRFAFPDRCKQVRVVASVLKDNAGVYGAALTARDRLGAR